MRKVRLTDAWGRKVGKRPLQSTVTLHTMVGNSIRTFLDMSDQTLVYAAGRELGIGDWE